MVQVPTATPVTVLPLTVQMLGVLEAKTTALPEAPPVALTVPVLPTLTLGATPKLMLCAAWPTVMFWLTCAAAL